MPKVIDICMKSSQHGQFLILNILQQIKKTLLMSDKKYSDEKVDVLSCFLVAERVLAGPVTLQRIRVANVAVSLCSGGTRFIKEDDIQTDPNHLNKYYSWPAVVLFKWFGPVCIIDRQLTD